jgi:hypothetical protein
MGEYNSYGAFASCGCLMGVVLDHPDDKKETAKVVAEWIR